MILLQVLIELKTVREQWQPPFRKETTTETIVIEEGEYFLQIPGKEDFVFRFIELRNDSVIIEFNSLFTPKNADRSGSRQVLLCFGEEKAFTAQWASNGVTYVVKPVKTVSVEKPQSSEIIEAEENLQAKTAEEKVLEQFK